MSTKVAVVIPVYRELNELEKISLAQCRKVLSRYPLIFVAPAGQNFSFVAAGDMIVHFPAENFRSVNTYSQLMLSPQFYATFADFDYILIYQLDAFVFYDALEEFCSLGYDYIGAPWPIYLCVNSHVNGKAPRVGNGGFCLRKVKVCRKLAEQINFLTNWADKFERFDDDAFFSKCGMSENVDFNVAPVGVAKLFAMEWHPAHHVKHFGLPFGCHGWTNFSADFYIGLFSHFGYDLRPLLTRKEDRDDWRLYLTASAMKRLLRNTRRKLLPYLPTKHFASIRVINSPDAIKVLSCLLTEDNSLAAEIYIYDETEWTNLLRDLQPENSPHLLIVTDYDVSLVKALERVGLRYGKDFVSFQREYADRCAQIIGKFGRRNPR